MKKLTREKFIEKAKQVHGDKYDYSKVEYINSQTKVCIICPEHGEFWQKPNSHLLGYGCNKCAIEKRSKLATKTTDSFIERAKKVHGDKYDYSKVDYKGKGMNVCIICPKHGEFWQTPHNHLSGAGCPKCKNEYISKKYSDTTETFIEKAKKVHGDKYDYSKVNYINSRTKVCIVCPEHGEFWQRPNNHLNGWGCSKCSNEKTHEKQRLTTEEFIERAIEVHGKKYDYSKVNYINNQTKVCIICHEKDEYGIEHGEFWQTPNNHLNGDECPRCSKKYKCTTEEFIQKAKLVHGNKYDYSQVEYINSKRKVCIICPEHGEFWQKPSQHLITNCPCQKCSCIIRTTEDFINKAILIHGNKYNYSKVEYKGKDIKVCIICPEHGEFWQSTGSHLSGNGCCKCSETKLENTIEQCLKNENIDYIFQYSKADGLEELGCMRIDFFLPKQNIAIECQGEQHFAPNEFFGGVKQFKKQINNDQRKLKICKDKNIYMLYFTKEAYIDRYKLSDGEGYTYVCNLEKLLKYIKK